MTNFLHFQAPTTLAFVAALRQRGDQFSGLNIRGGDLNGPTGISCSELHVTVADDCTISVWSMPGGFTSLAGGRNGYQDVDAGRDVESHPRPPPSATATAPPAPSHAAPPPPQAPGGYQTTSPPQP